MADSAGFPCPTCGGHSAVCDSRYSPENHYKRRIRRCTVCHLRFSTREVITSDLSLAHQFELHNEIAAVLEKFRQLAETPAEPPVKQEAS